MLQIAGGSGLTPMLQVIKEIARNPEDKTKVSFIFANQSVEDIIIKKDLDELNRSHDNITVSLPQRDTEDFPGKFMMCMS